MAITAPSSLVAPSRPRAVEVLDGVAHFAVDRSKLLPEYRHMSDALLTWLATPGRKRGVRAA